LFHGLPSPDFPVKIKTMSNNILKLKTMNTETAVSVLKIARINEGDLSKETKDFITDNFTPTWKDGTACEDIYDIDLEYDNVIDGNYGELSGVVLNELSAIQTIVHDNKCGYFFITY
jgi:hypothetical protein